MTRKSQFLLFDVWYQWIDNIYHVERFLVVFVKCFLSLSLSLCSRKCPLRLSYIENVMIENTKVTLVHQSYLLWDHLLETQYLSHICYGITSQKHNISVIFVMGSPLRNTISQPYLLWDHLLETKSLSHICYGITSQKQNLSVIFVMRSPLRNKISQFVLVMFQHDKLLLDAHSSFRQKIKMCPLSNLPINCISLRQEK